MIATDEEVTYVIRGEGGTPIAVVTGMRLDDRRFAIRASCGADRVIDHIPTGSRAFTGASTKDALDGLSRLLAEKGEASAAKAFARAMTNVREYERSLL
jgi:hypothetical protein